MLMMDHHRPGYLYVPDELRKLRQATRDEYVQRLQNAWRRPQRDAAEPGQQFPGGSDAPPSARDMLGPRISIIIGGRISVNIRVRVAVVIESAH